MAPPAFDACVAADGSLRTNFCEGLDGIIRN